MRRTRVLSVLLAALLLEVPPAGAQGWRCGGATIEWVGGAPAAGATTAGAVDSTDSGYGPVHDDGSLPTVPEPAGMDRRLWDALVFDAHDVPNASVPTFRPVNLRQTQVIPREVVPTIGICVQGPEHSDFGKRVEPYANAMWWRQQIDRWTGLNWSGELRVADCTTTLKRGWINVREAQPHELGRNVLAATRNWRGRHPHSGGAWRASEIFFATALDDIDEDDFEAAVAHELGHALGFFHVPYGSGFVMAVGVTPTWPEEESAMARLAYRAGPFVRYPGLVREVDPGDSDENDADRPALTALYDATDGRNWTDRTNWGTATPLDHWYGVSTGTGGRVTWLVLHRNQLAGPLPAELGSLSELQNLKLEGNALSGPIPPELGGMSNLEVLYAGENALSGPIPPELADMSNLTQLVLALNDLSGKIPPELSGLSRLRFLDLGHNNLTGRIPAELGRLAEMDTLVLVHNNLTGPVPAELSDLSGVRYVELNHNQLSGTVPPELGLLSRLEIVSLEHNRLSGPVPASFTNLTNLRQLTIQENDGLCAPADDEFQAWLATVQLFRGPICGAATVPVLPVAALMLAATLLGGLGVGLLGPRHRR